jgi:hypothetical protein
MLPARRRPLVVAWLECLFVPFGTILGLFTIIALSRQAVKTLFSSAPAGVK